MTDDQKNDMPTPEEAEASGLPLEEAEERGTEPAPEAAPSEEGTPAPEEGPQASSPPVEEEEQPAPPQPAEAPVPDVQEPDLPRQEAPAEAQQPAQPVPPPQPGYYGPYGPVGYGYGMPPQQGWGQPAYPQGMWQQAPWPQNGAPQPGAVPPQGPPPGGQPPMGWYPMPAQGPAQPAPQPPRKKMGLGLKVFLWMASALAAGAIVGFIAFAVYAGVTGGSAAALPGEELPSFSESQPDSSQEEPGESQDGSASQAEIELPEVDVTPNEEGLTIHEKPEGDALDAQEVYNRVVQSTVAITVSRTGEETDSSGTGIIATSDGYIITNAHVVLNTKSVLVTVTTYDGQQYDAVVVGMDRTTDLAVIKTNDYGFTPAEFGDSDQLTIGEWVVAIGNPGGERFASSLTRGIVSGLDRAVERYSEEGMTYIQTDAAINPGNSGGPLVNMYGQVVGINSSKIITDGYEGMGFAIPVSKAKDIIDQLLSGGYVEGRVRLGISGYDLGEAEASFYGVPRGFMIASIDEDSSFAGTEAQVNDIITAIDGEPVEDLQDISNLLLRYSPGDEITVTLYRLPENSLQGGEELEVTITLLEDKGETQK